MSFFTEFLLLLSLGAGALVVSIGYLATKAPKTTGTVAGEVFKRLLK